MNRLREFIKKNPIAGWAIVVGIVAIAGYMAMSQLMGGRTTGARTTAPPAAQAPPPVVATTPRPAAPAPAPTPAPATVTAPVPQVTAPKVVPSGPTGRADPFVPLVRTPGFGAPGTPPPPPPSATLPPPPFPVPPGSAVPPSGPGLPPPPLPAGAPSEGMVVTGIVGNSHAVAILNFGGRTEIVAEGETIGDLKILNIDSVRRSVTFLRAGRRFEVRMGGE